MLHLPTAKRNVEKNCHLGVTCLQGLELPALPTPDADMVLYRVFQNSGIPSPARARTIWVKLAIVYYKIEQLTEPK